MDDIPQEVALSLLVRPDGLSREDYDLISLTFTVESGDKVLNLIPITAVDGKLLVAVPLAAWHKTAKQRWLPRHALTQALKVEVLVAATSAPEVCLVLEPLKLWVGFLDKSLWGGLEVGANPIADMDVVQAATDGTEVQPYGPGLVEVADQHFAFASAVSTES